MFIKCFTKNKNNKIEFTEEELKKLLDEVYKYGCDEGNKKNYWWYTSPLYTSPTAVPSNPWYEYTTTSATTSDTSDSTININKKCNSIGEK